MANKKATCYILNVAHSMSSDFPKALSTLTENIEDKVLSERKLDMATVLLAGTEETHNILAEETPGQYQNISTLCPIAQPNLDLLRKLQNVTTSNESVRAADVLDAVIVAIQMIVQHCRHLKYIKTITLFTNNQHEIDWLDINEVAQMLEDNDISLIIVGVDYEQYQSNNCPDMVKINYDNWHHLVSRSRDGDILSLTEAYELTQEDFVKEVRPTPSYRGYLYLGHPLENNHFVAINIFMYLRTKEVRPKTSHKWSSLSNGPTYSIVSDSKYMLDTGDNKEGISVSDEVEIPKEELERAYKYGKTIVRIAEEEMKYQQAKTRKEMTIIGFIPAATFPRHYLYSNASIITAGNYNTEEGTRALTALAFAMYEKGCLALVRYVPKDEGQVKIGILQPEFILGTDDKPNTFLLQFFDVPFAEDIREYKFKSMKNTAEYEPEAVKLMDNLVDSMNLDKVSKSYLTPESNFNPILWRLNKAIKMRAVNPSVPIPELKPSFNKQFEIAPELVKEASEFGEKINQFFKVRQVKEKGKKRAFSDIEFTSNITDISDILNSQKAVNPDGYYNNDPRPSIIPSTIRKVVTKIGPERPVADFHALLEQPSEIDMVEPVCKEMAEHIMKRLKNSFGEDQHEVSAQCLKALRDTCAAEDAAAIYNGFVRELKNWRMEHRSKDSHRVVFWNRMKLEKLGLITKDECEDTDIANITKEIADQFWIEQEESTNKETKTMDQDEFDDINADDLEDML